MLSPPALWLLAVCLGFVCFVKRCIFNPVQLVAVGGIHCITSILAVLGASPPGAALLCIGPAGSCAYTLPMLPAVTVSNNGGTETALIKRAYAPSISGITLIVKERFCTCYPWRPGAHPDMPQLSADKHMIGCAVLRGFTATHLLSDVNPPMWEFLLGFSICLLQLAPLECSLICPNYLEGGWILGDCVVEFRWFYKEALQNGNFRRSSICSNNNLRVR